VQGQASVNNTSAANTRLVLRDRIGFDLDGRELVPLLRYKLFNVNKIRIHYAIMMIFYDVEVL
jgi:hypothetical protein